MTVWSFYVHQCVLIAVDGEPVWYGRGQDANGAKQTTWLGHDSIVGYPDHYVQSTERHPMDLLSREIERLTAPLAQYEKPKRFAVLEKDFSYASGELTYTLKLKRRVIEEHYQDVIARLYADVEEPRPSRQS